MNFVSKLWRVAILGICATLVISVATGLLFLIDGYPSYGPGQLGWLEWFGLGFVSSLYIGGIAGLFYGVPLYTLYLRLDTFLFWVLASLATAPGLVLSGNAFVEDGPGIYLLCGGAAFLLIVHTLAGKWPRLQGKEPPNNTPH